MEPIYEFDDIRYGLDPMVYPVEEDSLLLLKAAIPYFSGKSTIMEMGCGTGLLTLIASRNGARTIAVDREPRALTLLRKNLSMNGLTSRLFISDLFEGIPISYKGKLDLICFNPPYLHNRITSLDRRSDLAFAGGHDGWELTERFLNSSHDFISESGMIIMISYPDWSMDDMDPERKFETVPGEVTVKDIDGEVLEVRMLRLSP